jgi:hypothetical protein
MLNLPLSNCSATLLPVRLLSFINYRQYVLTIKFAISVVDPTSCGKLEGIEYYFTLFTSTLAD